MNKQNKRLERSVLNTEIFEIFKRESIYIWYYFELQLRQIFPYWVVGMVLGSMISVFAKEKIHNLFGKMKDTKWGLFGIIPACLLGIASPLCMYGTIPLAASFSHKGMRQDWLASFMMASVLLNPQLIMYSTALGTELVLIRVLTCFFCGIAAGLVVYFFYKDKEFFNFKGFVEPKNRDTDPNIMMRFLKNLWRNVKATGMYFLLGVLLSALFQRYVPADGFASFFGEQEGFGVLMAATIGVPLYVCGGGTIPLLRQWLWDGMSIGAATSFMITGPATKITNLGALKIVLGAKRFLLYIAFVIMFSLLSSWIVNLFF